MSNSKKIDVTALLNEEQTPLSKIVCITNQKGGVGKTSHAFNFAHYLNELGYRVLAVDLDGQGSFTELFFVQSVLDQYVHTRAAQLFAGELEEFIPLCHPSGIDVVATVRNSHELTDIDTLGIEVAEVFYQNITKIAGNYDFLVVDTPPAPGVRTTSACASADYIFAPVLLDTFAIPALEGVLGSIQNIGELLGIELSIHGILINQVQDSSVETMAEFRELKSVIGKAAINTPFRQSRVFRRAQREGLPVWHYRHSGTEQRTSRESRAAYGEMAGRIKEIPRKRIAAFMDISRAVRTKHAQQEA